MSPPSTEAEPPGIRVRGIRKSFGSVVALDGIDLDVERGEIVAMLGRNGAGKSTLVRILGTTVLPDAGTAAIGGRDVVGDAIAVRRATGFVLGDERSWYWRLSGRANLEFFAALHGLGPEQARARAAELLATVRLSDAAERRFDGYSSGMRARLSVARALIVLPTVLLLDEPTRTLDPIVAAEVRQLVLGLAHDGRCAVLWVTHDLHEAAEVADRVVIVAEGRIVAEQRQPGRSAELSRLLAVHAGDPEAGAS